MTMEAQQLRPTIKQVLGQLSEEGLVAPDAVARARVVYDLSAQEAPLPWYVRVLVGGGAWVSTLFVLVFLGMAGLLFQGVVTMFLGALCAGAGLWLRRVQSSGRVQSSDFLVQLSLSLNLAGRGMIYFGLAPQDNGGQALVACAAFGIELAMVAVFPDAVNRFLSTIGAWTALLVLLRIADAPPALHDVVLALLGALTAAAWVMQPRLLLRFPEHHSPVAYGLSVALLASMVSSRMGADGRLLWLPGLFMIAVSMVTGEMILQELRIEGGRARLQVAAVVCLLGMLTLGSPGVTAALLLMALGGHRRAPLLVALASGALVLFGFIFYHDLELTLLLKSGLLLGSGLLLLGARAMVERGRSA